MLLISFAAFLLSNCGKIKKTDAEYEREAWINGFTDSIEYYQNNSKEIDSKLESLNHNISSMLEDFEMVKNPRAVEGYYILKGWEEKLPFTTTSLYARINEREKLELIATLSGATFNQLEIDGFVSEIVPNDQAFNFRHQRFNTVYFSGGKADTLAMKIADLADSKINLVFLENGKNRKTFQLPEAQKMMIKKTWNLYSSQMEARELQKQQWIASKKIDTFRHMIDVESKRLEK